MRFRPLFAFTVCLCLALAGCASATPLSETSPPISTANPSVSPTPTPTPTATPVDQLTITLDGILHAHDDVTDLVPFSDGQEVLALFHALTGVMPSGVDVQGPFPGTESGLTRYEWSDVRVMLSDDGRASDIAVLAPTVNDVPIQTKEGITVGSGRADIIAAQGWDVWDRNGDGIAEDLGLGSREVPGTHSLSRPGSVGVEYLLFTMKGDTVEQIHVPANDFSDI
jgi:hypothetical protein